MMAIEWSPALGIPIIESRFARDGSVFYLDGTIVVGTGPLSPLEAVGREARLFIRRGLANWLEWLGETVENEPTGREILAAIKEKWGPDA